MECNESNETFSEAIKKVLIKMKTEHMKLSEQIQMINQIERNVCE